MHVQSLSILFGGPVLKNLNIILNSGVFRIKIYPTEVFSVFRIPIYCVYDSFLRILNFYIVCSDPKYIMLVQILDIWSVCVKSKYLLYPTLAYIGHVTMTNTTHRTHCPVSTSKYQHLPERTPRLWWAHIIRTEDKICFAFK